MLVLVRALPPAAAFGRMCRHGQRQPQAQRQRRQRLPAPPERQQRDQQQRRQQPVAFVLPGGVGAAGTLAGGGLRLQHRQRLQVGVAGGKPRVATAAGERQRTQRRFVQPGMADASLAVAIGSPRWRTQPQRRYRVAGRAQACGFGGGARIGAVAQQQDRAVARTGLAQQAAGPFQRLAGVLPVHRHDLRRQCVEEQRDVGRVIGQWRHGERLVGIRDQRHFATAALAQQQRQFRAHLQQPARRQVGRAGMAGQVQHHDQRRLRFPQRLLHLAPARPGQGQHRQQQGDRHGQPSAAGAAAAIRQHVRQEVRVHRAAPIATPAPPVPAAQQHGRQQQQRPQPIRADEMQAVPERDHRRRSGQASASRPSSSAAASGHAYRSRRGRSAGPALRTGSRRSSSA